MDIYYLEVLKKTISDAFWLGAKLATIERQALHRSNPLLETERT